MTRAMPKDIPAQQIPNIHFEIHRSKTAD